jgi:cysteine desulfurase
MPTNRKPIYLDYAAATPLRAEVFKSMRAWQQFQFYNPSSLYGSAGAVKAALEDARHSVAQTIGAKKSEIIFTAGATESINLALLGAARSFSSAKVIATAIEHEAVLACLQQLDREGRFSVLVPVKPSGIVDPAEFEAAIDDQTVLVSVAYANSEIGTVQPIRQIARLIAAVRRDRQRRGVRTPLYLHTDAAQAAGTLDLHVSRLGVDLMTLSGSKVYGPKQSGCLYVRTGTILQPVIYGGGQERGLRSGTENVAAAVGFALALELAQSERKTYHLHLKSLRDELLSNLRVAIPELVVNGDERHRLSGNLNISIPGLDGESAVIYLDQKGVQVSTGSACATGRTSPSHVLLSIGRTADQANSSLRLTLGRPTTVAQVKYVSRVLPAIVAHLRRLKA